MCLPAFSCKSFGEYRFHNSGGMREYTDKSSTDHFSLKRGDVHPITREMATSCYEGPARAWGPRTLTSRRSDARVFANDAID